MSGLKINNNIPAMKGLRFMDETNRKLSQSLERLSSGFKINKGADDPAGLIISEQMRAQLAGLTQAIANSELDNTMIQTTEGALTEVTSLLIRMRQLALQSANTGANDAATLQAIQLELDNGVKTLGRLAQTAQFGKRKLLDGSTGLSGEAQGPGLTYIAATEKTSSSPVEGYVVNITQAPTRPELTAGGELTEENVKNLQVTFFEGGRTIKVEGGEDDTPTTFFGKLRERVGDSGSPIDLKMSEEGVLSARHRGYGSDFSFQVVSNVEGVFSEEVNMVMDSGKGMDIRGTVAGEAASGKGQVLTGLPGNDKTEGLQVRYSGPLVMVSEKGPDGNPVYDRVPGTDDVGAVTVANNSLTFQIVPDSEQKTTIALPAVRPQLMSRTVENKSGFRSLADVNVLTSQGATDTIRLVDAAIDDLNVTRGRLGVFQRNEVEKNISTLKIAVENLAAAESTIRDASVAEEITEVVKRRIQMQATQAALAQANQIPSMVIELLR